MKWKEGQFKNRFLKSSSPLNYLQTGRHDKCKRQVQKASAKLPEFTELKTQKVNNMRRIN